MIIYIDLYGMKHVKYEILLITLGMFVKSTSS